MAKTTKICECCTNPKPNLKAKEWGGSTLMLCETCVKAGSKKVLERIAKRAPVAEEPVKVEEPVKAEEPKAAEPEAKVEKPAKKAKAPKAKEPKAERVTVASTIRALVDQGKSNVEIWAVIQPQFGLDDDKRWYPGWYRNDYRKKVAAAAAKAEAAK